MFLTELKPNFVEKQRDNYIFFLKNYIIEKYIKGLKIARKNHKEKDYYCFVNFKGAIDFYRSHYDMQYFSVVDKYKLQKEIFQKVFERLREELGSESVRKLPKMTIFIGRENEDIFRKYLHYLKHV